MIPRRLYLYLENFSLRPFLSPVAGIFVEELKGLLPGLKAVIYYGSCFQEGEEKDGLLDLYALVKSYNQAYSNPLLAAANYLLPPNVFYLEKQHQGFTYRSKYAVMSLWQFERAVSPRWFHSYFWGRFSQPAAIVWWADKDSAKRAVRSLAQAVITFLSRVLPLAPQEGSVKELWLTGLSLSYRAELRPEKPEKIKRLWQNFGEHFLEITSLAAPALPFPLEIENGFYRTNIPENIRRRTYLLWHIRIAQGKLLSVLRLLKASFTFRGGVDYALWKIERHTGKRLKIPTFLRRHPSLALLLWGWKVLLAKGVR